jgi:hypothetical protein
MIVPRDRASFVQELLVAEVLARRGEGPLARRHWPRPRPRPDIAAAPERTHAADHEPNADPSAPKSR